MSSRRALLLVLGLAFVLRLAFLLFAVGHEDRLTETADVKQYVELARDLSGGYGGEDSRLFDQGLRITPLYPVLLAAGLALSRGSLVGAVFPFLLVSLGTIVLTYQLTARLFGGGAARWAALVLAVDPVSIVWTGYPQPEALFTFFLVAGVLLVAKGADARQPVPLAAAGVAFGAAALTRPLGLYLPLVVAVVVLGTVAAPLRRRAVMAGALVVASAVPVGAWVLRNNAVSGVPILSAIEGRTLLNTRAAGALAESEGIRTSEALARLDAKVDARTTPDMNAAERSLVERRLALEVIRDRPLGFAKWLAKGTFRLLVGPGRSPLVLRITGSSDGGGLGTVLTGVAWVVLLLIYACAIIAIPAALRLGGARWILPAAVAGYLVVISTGSYSRYRYPIMPFIAVFAGLGAARVAAGRGR